MDYRFEGDGYMGKNPSSEAVVTLWSQTMRVNGDRYGGGNHLLIGMKAKGWWLSFPTATITNTKFHNLVVRRTTK